MKLENIFKYPFLALDTIRRNTVKRQSQTGLVTTTRKYDILRNELRKHKPKMVLECGSGDSTHIIAEEIAVWGGKLVSMEEDKKYATKYSVVSDKAPYTYMMFRGVGYRDIPKQEYDFVYIDGPTTSWGGEKTFDFDLINVVKNQDKPIRALIDSRMSTVFVLSLIFGDKVSFDYTNNMGYIEPVTKKDMRDTNGMIRALPMYFVKRKS